MSNEFESPFEIARAIAPLADRHLRRTLGRRNARSLLEVLPKETRAQFPGQRHVEFVQSLPQDDPLRGSLLAWCTRLTETRVNAAWSAEDERLLREVKHVVREPKEQRFSLEELLDEARTAVLNQGSGEAQSRRSELALLRFGQAAQHSAALSEHRLGASRRLREVRERLGLAADEVELQVQAEGASSAELCQSLAERALRQCAILLSEAGEGGSEDPWVRLMAGLSGAGLTEGWPARLAPDSLQRMLGLPELCRSVSLPDFALPERLCPSSFARGAARWGRALRQRLVSTDLPSCLVWHPDDFDGHLMGQLLFDWVLAEPFARRVRDRSKAAAADERRHRAHLLCCHLAVAALRAFLHEQQLVRELSDSDYEEATTALLGAPRPWSSVLVELPVRRSERARFCAMLCAQVRRAAFVDEFDEDWLSNHRAQEKLREEAKGPATRRVSGAELEAGLTALLERIRADRA